MHGLVSKQNHMTHAMGLMIQALAVLDMSGAPAQIGANLDLAITQLRDELDEKKVRPGPLRHVR